MIRLLGRASSINVRKVLWTLDEMALDFTHEPWGTEALPLQSPAFLALNPHALVPVLQHEGVTLRESNTICRYLAARFGRTDLLPAQPAERACVEQWMDWQGAELNPAWRHAFMGLVRRSPAHQDAAAIATSLAQWHRQMGLLDAALARTGAYITGEAFTLADIPLGLSVHRWFMTPCERPRLPAVDAYYALLGERAAFRRHARTDQP